MKQFHMGVFVKKRDARKRIIHPPPQSKKERWVQSIRKRKRYRKRGREINESAKEPVQQPRKNQLPTPLVSPTAPAVTNCNPLPHPFDGKSWRKSGKIVIFFQLVKSGIHPESENNSTHPSQKEDHQSCMTKEKKERVNVVVLFARAPLAMLMWFVPDQCKCV